MIDHDGTSSLDQPFSDRPSSIEIIEKQKKYEEDYVLDFADRVIERCLKDEDFDDAFYAIGKFRAMNKASSLGVAKLLHAIKSHWVDSEESFEAKAMRMTNYSSATIQRYVWVWELLSGDFVPEEFREQIHDKTMQQLVKVADTVVNQEYELDHDDWLALSESIDEKSTSAILQEAKGKPRNKNHMSLKLYDDGRLVVFQGNKEEHFGMLFVDKDVELVKKAIRRVTKDSGISRENEY